MSSPTLYHSLLRPPILQILRAAGFHATRPAVLDTITDLAARYLLLLAQTTAGHAENSHEEVQVPTTEDVLNALRDVGALRPQLSDSEEWLRGEEDMRGLDAFINWFTNGNVAREIKRCAGFIASDGELADVDLLEEEDYLTALKKKHSKTGEESRYQGTVLGKDSEGRRIHIEGAGDGGPKTIKQWSRQTRKRSREEYERLEIKRKARSKSMGSAFSSAMDEDSTLSSARNSIGMDFELDDKESHDANGTQEMVVDG
ncbi:hypothetical protein KEM55_002186 [Ascosphaera atra]|nr:hypothetical protein KEM55_002186 [Ascosphaera atra]